MEIKIFKPQDHKIKTVIYWASWTWKTTFGATAPKPIFASAENWLLSVADQDIPYVDIKSLKDLKELLKYLKDWKHDYESVVIDSISEINDIIKAWIEQSKWRAMQLQDWWTVAKEIENILRWFRNLPMHTIFIAQEKNTVDEDKIAKITPSLNWQSAVKIAYFMDIVWYISINKKWERCLTTSANHKLLTKDRSNKIWDNTEMDFTVWAKKIAEIKTWVEKILVNSEIEISEEKKSHSEKTSDWKETDRKNTFDKHKAILEKCWTMDELKKAWWDVSFDKWRLNDAYFKELVSIKETQKFEIDKKDLARNAKNNTQDEEAWDKAKKMQENWESPIIINEISDAEIVEKPKPKPKTDWEKLAEKSTKKLEKTLTKAEKDNVNSKDENLEKAFTEEKDYSKDLKIVKNLDELKKVWLAIPQEFRVWDLSKLKDELKEKLSTPEKNEEKPKKSEKEIFDDAAFQRFEKVRDNYKNFDEALKEIKKTYKIDDEMKNKVEVSFVF